MMPKKLRQRFWIGFIIFFFLAVTSYFLLVQESPFFDSIQARIYFVLMATSMVVFVSLLENYFGWNKQNSEKLKERFKQITFLFSVPFLFLVLTGWGYTFFLIMILVVPLGLALVEKVPIFHYIKLTRKKVFLTLIIFFLLYFTAKQFYSAEFFEKETFYILLISHMVSSIIANFYFRILEIRKPTLFKNSAQD